MSPQRVGDYVLSNHAPDVTLYENRSGQPRYVAAAEEAAGWEVYAIWGDESTTRKKETLHSELPDRDAAEFRLEDALRDFSGSGGGDPLGFSELDEGLSGGGL